MGFGDLKSDAGVKTLNEFLAERSYIQGYSASQADAVVFEALASAPKSSFQHALRWYNHVKSFDNKNSLPGAKKPVTAYGPEGDAASEDEDDDDLDLFGSDEDDDAAEKLKEERVAAYNARKSKKPVLIAKSNIILDVKPWDDETDMAKVEELVRAVQTDGLLWGTSKLQPVGYGIKKLVISCVVEDDKVGTDFLEESITAHEDYVQSVDVAAFNKI